MRIKIRCNEEQLVVYREPTGVLLFTIAIAICCLVFGVTFVIVGKAHVFMQIIGGLFAIAGVLMVVGLPKFYRKMQREGGAILLRADPHGLTLAPVLNMEAARYPWSDIERIVLTNKLITRETGERGYASNQAIVYFRRGGQQDDIKLLQRSRSQIWKSPKGRNVCIVDLPKQGSEQIKAALGRFAAKTSEVLAYSGVTFDYVNDDERFTH